MKLRDGSYLLAQQILGVRESSGDGLPWLTTLAYRYQWQSGADDGTWLVRWDYSRDPPVPPHVNVHFGRGVNIGGKDSHKLHLPTGRVAIEDVVRFLAGEAGVTCNSDGWPKILDEAAAIFQRIQRREPSDA